MKLMCCAGFVVVFLLCGATPGTNAQSLGGKTVSGRIHDESGSAVPGVAVQLTASDGGAPRTATTDRQGRYRFERIPPGEYELRAGLPGFRQAVTRLTVAGDAVRTVDLLLRIPALSETVTVTRAAESVTGVPYAVVIFSGDHVQAFQRRASPAESFTGIPGLFVENRRNASLSGGLQLAIRSPLPRFGLRGIHIVQDGIPITLADGTTEPTSLDLGSVGHVEILRGPSSVLYGNSAGGVITVQTEFPDAAKLVVEPDLQLGSFGHRQQQMKLHGTAGKVSYLLNGSHLRTNGFRAHSASEIRRVNAVVRAVPAPNTHVRAIFNLYDLPFGESANTLDVAAARTQPRSTRPQAFSQGWGESTSQVQAGVSVAHHFGDDHVVNATAWGLRREVFNPIPFAIVDLRRSAAGFRSDYGRTSTPGTLPVRWTMGLDVSRQRDDRLESSNAGVATPGGRARSGEVTIDQLEEVISIGSFVQGRALLGTRWSFSAGARYDHHRFAATDHYGADGDQSGKRTLRAVSPMLGLTYTATESLNVFASFATAYQTPTTVELSNTETGAGGFNPELGPEHLRTLEAGIRGAVEGWRLTYIVSGYASRLDDAMVQFTRDDEATFFRNAGRAARRGMEGQITWTPATSVRARLSYTHQDYEFTRFVSPDGDFSGLREPGVPGRQVFAGLTYRGPFGVYSAFEVRSVASYPVNSSNSVYNWAYQVANARIGLTTEWKKLRLRPFAGIDNLLDERYNASVVINAQGNRFFEPAPGREWYAGVSLRATIF